MKRNSTSPKIKKSVAAPKDTGTVSFVYKNVQFIIKCVGAILVVIFAIVMWKRSTSVIKDLVNANSDVLKDAVFGDKPHMFYCNRGLQSESIPSIFSELNQIKGSKFGFASVNCSQLLPSGKSLYERFKLKKEIRPTIFSTAPWSKPQQAGVSYLKDVTTLKKFTETVMAPKGTDVASDKDFRKFCAFSKNLVFDENEVSETCLVMVKGARFSKVHTDLEQKLVLQYPRLKIAAVNGIKKRLSIEDASVSPAEDFALKFHAVRNGTHYISMVNPATWDYINTFVSHALGAPLNAFTGEGDELIKLESPNAAVRNAAAEEKAAATRKKLQKKKNQRAKKWQAEREAAAAAAAERGESLDTEPVAPKTDSSSGSQVPAVNVDPIEVERVRREKERLRREEMDRLEKAHLFDEGGDEGEGDDQADSEEGQGEDGGDEEDEALIEL